MNCGDDWSEEENVVWGRKVDVKRIAAKCIFSAFVEQQHSVTTRHYRVEVTHYIPLRISVKGHLDDFTFFTLKAVDRFTRASAEELALPGLASAVMLKGISLQQKHRRHHTEKLKRLLG